MIARREFLAGLAATVASSPKGWGKSGKKRAPRNTRPPALPAGAPVVGQAFTATSGTWDGATSVERQWEYL